MAAKKLIKAKAKEAVEVKTIDMLLLELVAKQADLIEAKRGHKQGELVNTCIIRSTRKEIARLNTAIGALKATSMPIKQQGEEK